MGRLPQRADATPTQRQGQAEGDATRARSREYIDAALLNLTTFDDSTAKRALLVVADYMVNRDS